MRQFHPRLNEPTMRGNAKILQSMMQRDQRVFDRFVVDEDGNPLEYRITAVGTNIIWPSWLRIVLERNGYYHTFKSISEFNDAMAIG